MAPRIPDTDILWLEQADSTNSELRRRLSSSDNLSIVAARSQSRGRGQGDHTWYSSPDTNLTFSILYRFGAGQMKATDALLITCVTTLGIRDYLLTKGIESRIKWPNDIWVGDRKICGILIENILESGCVRESIVGIGLDVNEKDWPSELPNPVSMRELTGDVYDLETELPLLRNEICRRFGMLSTAGGRISLQEEFERFMFRLHAEP